jgi:hypothetical protein
VIAPDAAREVILSLVRPTADRRLLLVDNDIFEQHPGHPPRRIGRLFENLRELAASAPRPAAANAGGLERARRCAEQVEEYRFVLQEILPLLQSIAANRNSALDGAEQTARHFRVFEERAASLLNVAGKRTSALAAPGLTVKERATLIRLLGLPCALVGMAVIPLQLVPRPTPWDLHVTIGSRLFRYAIERSRSRKDFLQAVGQAEEWISHRALARNPILQKCTNELLASTQTLLSSCGFTGEGLRIPVRGVASSELQCQPGSWMLAYGPEHPRTRQGPPIFVGVAIRGRTRKERLSVAPIVSRTATGFITKDGESLQGGICMGDVNQFAHLCSQKFTDAEALLFWLDAALIVATGRSVFHQQWRKQTGRNPRRNQPVRPNRRRT